LKKIVLGFACASVLLGSCTKKETVCPQPTPNQNGVGTTQVDPTNNIDTFQMTIAATQWSGPRTTDKAYVAEFDQPDVAASSAALIAIHVKIGGAWQPMPYNFGGKRISVSTTEYGFDCEFYSIDGTDPGKPGSYTFRVIIKKK